jgi:hypothetical protein
VPRKGRKRLVGRVEDNERRDRERRYAELEDELHREWQAGQSEARPGEQSVADNDATTE